MSPFAQKLKHVIPAPLRRSLGRFLGTAQLHERINQLEDEIVALRRDLHSAQSFLRALGADEQLWDASRQRWKGAEPTANLTWDREISGDAFIETVASHDVFKPEGTVLEVGPGYGRLLKAFLGRSLPFRKYVAVDISPTNVEYLRSQFPSDRIEVVEGDIEKLQLGDPFDVLMSSLTFKHLYPTFEKALRNLAPQAAPGALLFFDLIEKTSQAHFEKDRVTYVRCYTKPEIEQILEGAGLERVAFDYVQHDEDHTRLLVIARKPPEQTGGES